MVGLRGAEKGVSRLWGLNPLFRSEEIQNHLEIQNPEVGNLLWTG